jgi:RNA polymerase sigma factor (sigma-70 family)
MDVSSATSKLADHLFRHESGKMISALTRLFGMHNLQMAEDVVQDAFVKAVQLWKLDKIPENPSAWLMTTAKNKAIDIIRRQQNFYQYSIEAGTQLEQHAEEFVNSIFLDTEIRDSQLQLIFACCHPHLKPEDRIALTLKLVSGFSVQEISRALLSNETVIAKRIYRAKESIRINRISLESPAGHELHERIDTVHTILYLMFNEGYASQKSEEPIRRDLCVEAMRLCLLLTEHPSFQLPSSCALLSLMCLHAARFESRISADQSIIQLADQDRSKWDEELIRLGYAYLNKSSNGEELTPYHIEAAIAAEHCLAPWFTQTNWKRMLDLYNLLVIKKDEPTVRLNRAVVLSYVYNPDVAISDILQIDDVTRLLNQQYLFAAVLGEMYLRNGDMVNAHKYLNDAMGLTNSSAEKKFLNEKMRVIGEKPAPIGDSRGG